MSQTVSWLLGLFDQLFRVLNFLLGKTRPKFFSKGRGDLDSICQRRDALLADIAAQRRDDFLDRYTLQHKDITWNATTRHSQHDDTVKMTEGCFLSPLADFLPEESKTSRFILVEPSAKQAENTKEQTDRVFVLMLPATGEMGKGTRLSMARSLAIEYGWSSIILTAAYYGRRKPSGQKLFFLNTVADIIVQAESIFEEGAMLATYFQNQYNNNNNSNETNHDHSSSSMVCITGFSFGAAMAANTSVLAVQLGANGQRLACAPYVGSASPVVIADGILQTSVDWDALGKQKDKDDHATKTLTAQEWLYEEFNKTQLTLLTTDKQSGKPLITENRIAVIKGISMKHDAFIQPRYSLELQNQLLTATSTCNPPSWEWFWGGHVLAALMRPIWHKALVVDTVKALQDKVRSQCLQK